MPPLPEALLHQLRGGELPVLAVAAVHVQIGHSTASVLYRDTVGTAAEAERPRRAGDRNFSGLEGNIIEYMVKLLSCCATEASRGPIP